MRFKTLNKEELLEERILFIHVTFLEKELKARPGSLRTSKYRFVTKGENAEFYDMISDSSQEKDIAKNNANMVADFTSQYQGWFNDASRNYQPTKPISLKTNFVELPAFESQFKGYLRFIEGHGWAHDYLVD
ncbi:MAG: hypothetical protein ACI9DJ_000741 [Algoriphagus sp.]|jgi:hypothetical protein